MEFISLTMKIKHLKVFRLLHLMATNLSTFSHCTNFRNPHTKPTEAAKTMRTRNKNREKKHGKCNNHTNDDSCWNAAPLNELLFVSLSLPPPLPLEHLCVVVVVCSSMIYCIKWNLRLGNNSLFIAFDFVYWMSVRLWDMKLRKLNSFVIVFDYISPGGMNPGNFLVARNPTKNSWHENRQRHRPVESSTT